MGLDAGFLQLLTMTATWRARTGEDQWGNNAYAAPVALKCFIAPTSASSASTSIQNTEVLTSLSTAITCDAVGIKAGDRITLPNGTISYVSAVSTTQDEDGSDLLQEVTVTSIEGV